MHIAAPTTAGYDNVYRAQAAATLDFVPVRRIDVGRVTWPSRRLFLVEGEEELARFRERIGEAVKRRADVEEEEEEEARPTKRACRGGLNLRWEGRGEDADDDGQSRFRLRHLPGGSRVAVAAHRSLLLPAQMSIPLPKNRHCDYHPSVRSNSGHHVSPHNSTRRSSYRKR